MRFVEVVKHYPGQQQVNLSVEIEVPGSWFDGTEMGSLSASERRQKYKAQAVEYAEVREFPGAPARARLVKEPAIRFICLDYASSDPNSDGYWMQLSQSSGTEGSESSGTEGSEGTEEEVGEEDGEEGDEKD